MNKIIVIFILQLLLQYIGCMRFFNFVDMVSTFIFKFINIFNRKGEALFIIILGFIADYCFFLPYGFSGLKYFTLTLTHSSLKFCTIKYMFIAELLLFITTLSFVYMAHILLWGYLYEMPAEINYALILHIGFTNLFLIIINYITKFYEK